VPTNLFTFLTGTSYQRDGLWRTGSSFLIEQDEATLEPTEPGTPVRNAFPAVNLRYQRNNRHNGGTQ
jgi:hypothetical protein